MSDVFISYSRKDSRFVAELAEGLRAQGKDVWVDIEGIRDAEVFPEALRSAIEGCDGFVFVISPASVQSKYCIREVDDAVDAGKRIVPIDLGRVPSDDVPEPIRVRNWIPGNGDIGATLERVVTALDTDLEHASAHTHWELKALEWDGKGRDSSLLLRGDDLASAEGWIGAAEAKDPPPTPLQREYLTVSRQAAAHRQRRVAIVAVAVAVVSLALLVFALIQRGQAQSARTTNESRAVAFASQAQAAVDPERALLMAMAAAKTRATPDALFALRNALDADPLVHRFPSYGAQSCKQPSPGVSFNESGVLAVGTCNGRLRLIDRNHRVVRSVTQPDPAAPLRFNPDGSTLAVAGNGRIRFYDPQTLAGRGELRVPGYPQRIVFSGDGSYLAATSSSTTKWWTSVWDTQTRRLTMRRPGPPPTSKLAPIGRGVGFVDGGRALAIGSPIGPVTIVASQGGRTLRTLPDREDTLIGVDPDGRYLAVGGYHTHGQRSGEGVVTLWDTWTWKHPRVVAAAAGLRPRNIVVSHDGTRVAVGWSDGSAGIYSLFVDAQLANFLGPPKPVSTVNWSPDNRTVAVGAADGSVRLWRAGGAEKSYTELGTRLAWDQPAVSNKSLTVLSPPNLVRRLTLPGLEPVSTSRIPLPRGAMYTYGSLSPSGSTAAMTRSDKRIDVWDLAAGRRLVSLPISPPALAAISHDDRRLILLDGPHNGLVDLRTGRVTPIRERARFCRGQWHSARFSDDDKMVVGGANCGEVLAWNARTGKLLRRRALPGQISALALSHDKRLVAAASPEGHVSLLDLRSGSIGAIPAAARGITSLDFGAGDKTLAAGVSDQTARIWDLRKNRLLRKLPLQDSVMLRFTPNGRTLIASELSGALLAFDPCPGCENLKTLMSAADERVTRKLTAAERSRYLSGF